MARGDSTKHTLVLWDSNLFQHGVIFIMGYKVSAYTGVFDQKGYRISQTFLKHEGICKITYRGMFLPFVQDSVPREGQDCREIANLAGTRQLFAASGPFLCR